MSPEAEPPAPQTEVHRYESVEEFRQHEALMRGLGWRLAKQEIGERNRDEKVADRVGRILGGFAYRRSGDLRIVATYEKQP